MAKRYTDTLIWKNQRWFRKLKPEYKLAFCYIKDNCNHAGIWNIDCSDLIEDLGIDEFDFADFIDSVNTEYDKVSGKKINKERFVVINNRFLFITGFVQFQYEGKDKLVNHFAAPVRTALIFLQSIDILEDSIRKGYITLKQPLTEGWTTPKDKDKDKDKENNIKGGVGGKMKGVRFNAKKNSVIFADGSEQELGTSQKTRLKFDDITPQEILKGEIY